MYYHNAYPFLIRESQYHVDNEDDEEDEGEEEGEVIIDNNNKENYNKKTTINATNRSANSASSSLSTSIGEDVKIADPNYSWILKDLNLNDKKRVIDVTDIIEKKEEEEQQQKQQQQQQEKNATQAGELNSKSKNETLQDATTSLVYDTTTSNVNAAGFKKADDTDGDDEDIEEDEEDHKMLEEQLTNILSTQHNPNYESVDMNNVYYSNNYEEDEEEEGDDENEKVKEQLLKTATFKMLSPFNAELFSETDTESELEELNMMNRNNKKQYENADEDDDDVSDDDDDEVDDNNIKTLQKKYKKIIEQTADSSDDSDTIDNNNENNVSRMRQIFEPKKIENEEKLVTNSRKVTENNSNPAITATNGNSGFKKFSKSFEISLNDLDDRIDRLNSEIKIKRNPDQPQVQQVKYIPQQQQQANGADDSVSKPTLNSTYEKGKTSTISIPNLTDGIQRNYPLSFSPNKIADQTPSLSMTISSSLPSAPTGVKSPPKSSPQKQQQQQDINTNVVETLKKEWSQVLDKVTQDYNAKLEEQRRKHEEQIQMLCDEIKTSIKQNQQNNDHIQDIPSNLNFQQQPPLKQSSLLQSSSKIMTTNDKDPFGNGSFTASSLLTNDSTTQIQPFATSNKRSSKSIENLVKEIDVNQSEKHDYLNNIKNFNRSISNDPSYVSNLRLSLKTKHSRHIQDLKSYYEQEIDELRRELSKAQSRFNAAPSSSSQYYANSNSPRKSAYESSSRPNMDDAVLIAEMKSQNLINLKKLYESEQTVERLRCENYEMKSQMNAYKSELFNKDEVIKKLENHFNDLELQLTESSKANEQQMRATQMEKMNYLKKCQEQEELKKELKYAEFRLNDLENKICEKDNLITSLQSKITKFDADMARMDYEYSKLRSKYSSNNSTLLLQTMNNDYESHQQQPQQQHSMHVNRYSSAKSAAQTTTASPLMAASVALSSASFNHSLTNLSPNSARNRQPVKSPSTNSLNVSTPTTPRGSSDMNRTMSPRNQDKQAMQFLPTNLLQLSPEKHIEYIDHLENEFDKLMRRKQQLDAQLTRLPYKATNTNMHVIRQSLENEVSMVDKQLASVKLELRKLNIIKTTH